jgi:hypothetical protein
VVENDPGLTELMVRSVLKFTNPSPRFIFCDNTNGKNINKINKCFPDNLEPTIIKNEPNIIGGSNRHSSGLNAIFSLAKTKYVAVVENDVVVLNHDWYKIKNGCYSKASLKNGREQTFHMCFFVAETKRLWKNRRPIDFSAGGRKGKKPMVSGQNYEWDNDVGWRLCKYIKSNYVDGVDFVDCKSGQGQYFDGDFQSDEFHYKGKCIAAHFGRGSNIDGKAVRSGFKHPNEQLKEWKKIADGIIR